MILIGRGSYNEILYLRLQNQICKKLYDLKKLFVARLREIIVRSMAGTWQDCFLKYWPLFCVWTSRIVVWGQICTDYKRNLMNGWKDDLSVQGYLFHTQGKES